MSKDFSYSNRIYPVVSPKPGYGLIRLLKLRWITMIATLVLTVASNDYVAAQSALDTSDTAGSFWLWTFLGRLHPLVVHFPVSLIVVALLLELIRLKTKSTELLYAIRILLVVGAGSAILAVIFGLLLVNTESYGSDILPIHQWTGVSTMILSVLTAHFGLRKAERMKRVLLVVTVVLVTVAGHYGASLTHGEEYLTGVLPFGRPDQEHSEAGKLFTASGKLSPEQTQELTLQVRTIFAHECYKCHGPSKVKGELRLDKKAFIMKGGENGPVVVPGNPGKSEIIRRITLPRDHKDAMPEKGNGLAANEIALLELWIKQGAPWPDGPEKSLYRVAKLEPRLPSLPGVNGSHKRPIDRFVNDYFVKKKIDWPAIVDDRTYIRRVYLDIVGLLPSPDSVEAFLNDSRPDKRERLASGLLARADDYAQQWLTFWNDALRNDYSGTGYITGGRADITSWLYTSLKENKPYDLFVKQLINPSKESRGFIQGIKWRGTINASQRTEMQAAQNVSQVFLGLNLKCASCHDSFISDWKLEEAYAFANIFADTVLEINRCDKPTGKFAGRRVLFQELGEIDPKAITNDRLKQLADFLVQPKDGRLYRTIVNRIWAQLMGRGIVEPVDVMDNEPWSQDLLDWLASDFVSNSYDMKKLIFAIVTSEAYQLPSVGMKDPGQINAPDFVFRGMLRRRMTAEQFSDAVSASIQPVYPDSLVVAKLLPKSVPQHIPFARASLVKNDPFLTALGRPNRETVSTGRTSQANLLQALELTNGTYFNEAIRRGADKWLNRYPDGDQLVKAIYRSTLGRLPLDSELAVANAALGKSPSEAQVQDFIWAMTLHPEFQLIY